MMARRLLKQTVVLLAFLGAIPWTWADGILKRLRLEAILREKGAK